MAPTPADASHRHDDSLRGDNDSSSLSVVPPPRVVRSSSSSSLQGESQPHGTGPGGMPSGISVQELKQMTALRMAHAQGHLYVANPYQYVVPAITQKRGNSPGRHISRLPMAREVPGAEGVARGRRHSIAGTEGYGDVGGKDESPTPPHLTERPPSTAMPHGLTVMELKELTKMRLAREAFNIPVYAVVQQPEGLPPPPPQQNPSLDYDSCYLHNQREGTPSGLGAGAGVVGEAGMPEPPPAGGSTPADGVWERERDKGRGGDKEGDS
ncbi:unnamed protein product, partial [Discosporangium mesarthrocarpum]